MTANLEHGDAFELPKHAEEVVARRSHELREKHASTFAEDVKNGVILVGIDKSNARQFLGEASAAKVLGLTGADLARHISATKLFHHLHVLSFLVLIILTVFLFRWWAILGIPALLLAQLLGAKSNVTGGGSFSLVIAFGFLLSLFAASSPVQMLWSIAGTVFGVAQRAMYAYPVAPLREALVAHPVLREMPIDLNILILKYPKYPK